MSGKKHISKGLSSKKVDDYLRFSVFLVLIGVAYIWNSYEAERQVALREAYRVEVKELKSRYLLKKSTLSAETRLSQIQDKVDTLGLRPLYEPAYRLVRGVEVPLSRIPKRDRHPGQRFESISAENPVAHADSTKGSIPSVEAGG
ncbi:MAG: FtsL-like putative cell division protein [Bacteroidota bacterium]